MGSTETGIGSSAAGCAASCFCMSVGVGSFWMWGFGTKECDSCADAAVDDGKFFKELLNRHSQRHRFRPKLYTPNE